MRYMTELTDDEANHFFNIEIGRPEETMVKFREEGIERTEYLVELNTNDVNIIAEALRKSGGLVPSGSGPRASIVSAHGVRIGVKALLHLEASMKIMKYYEMENHTPTASHLRCHLVVKNFKL